MSPLEIKASQIDTDPNVARTKVALFLDDEAVSGLSVVHHRMLVRGAAVRMGGIAGVSTRPQHRMKGYSRRVMTYSLDYMKEHRFDVSVLFGITGFYPRFGYATCMGEHTLSVKTAKARAASSSYSCREAADEDRAAIASIYGEENCRRTGTVVRDPSRWKWFRKGSVWHSRVKAYLITDGDEPVAYLAHDDVSDRFVVPEVGASRKDAYSAILHLAGELAAGMRQDGVKFILPPDRGLAGFCRSLDCRMESTYSSDGGPMGRIINQRSLFQKLIPEISVRAENSWLRDESFVLEIKTDLESTCIQLDRGSASLTTEAETVETANVRQDRLWQLLMGYHSVDDLLALGRIEGSVRALDALRTLFPPEIAFMWPADHF